MRLKLRQYVIIIFGMAQLSSCGINSDQNLKLNSLISKTQTSIEKANKKEFVSLTEYGYELKNRESMGKLFEVKLKYEWTPIYELIQNRGETKIMKTELDEKNDLFQLFLEVDRVDYYMLKFEYKFFDGEPVLSKLNVRDLSWECHEFKTVGYNPSDISLEQGFWSKKGANQFDSYGIYVTNKTRKRVEDIEFVLALISEKNNVMFVDTIKSSIGVEPNHKIYLPVNELRHRNLDFAIDHDGFNVQLSILNYYPHPSKSSCDQISQLFDNRLQ